MKTRTLLLLAIGCGFVILAAGVFLLFAGQDDPPPPAVVGQPVEIGDMTITVDGLTEEGAAPAVVAVELGGVDDDDGADAFRLVVPGAALRADPGGPDACVATTVETARAR